MLQCSTGSIIMPLTTTKPIHPVLPKPDNSKNGICESLPLNAIEDKELRKKLRNRQSALAARERKKARMLELERKVIELQESHKRLEHENHFLYSRLDFMKQKCLEAGVILGDEKELLSVHPLNSIHAGSVTPPNHDHFNNCNQILDQTRDYTGPPRPTNLQLFNRISFQYSATNNFSSNSYNHQCFADNINCSLTNMEPYESQRFSNKSNSYHNANLADLNPTAFYGEPFHNSRNKAKLNLDQLRVKQEMNHTGDFFESKDNLCTTLGQTLQHFSSNLTPPTSNNERSSFTPNDAQQLSPPNPLPSIDAMLESNTNRSTLTTKSVSQTNFVKTAETQQLGICEQRVNHNTKRRSDSVSNTFKKSKSFHSLNIIGPTTETSIFDWSKTVPQNQFNDITVEKMPPKAERQLNFDFSSPIEEVISNNFSASFGPQANSSKKTQDSVGVTSKCRPNDPSASDSGLSMDEHLDWVNDSTLFDF